jgi:hypothetical protein
VRRRIFRLDTWEKREEREERRESAADLAECWGTVCALKEQMLSGNVDASQGDGETEKSGHDLEITATVRSGHKRRGEREGCATY